VGVGFDMGQDAVSAATLPRNCDEQGKAGARQPDEEGSGSVEQASAAQTERLTLVRTVLGVRGGVAGRIEGQGCGEERTVSKVGKQ
jgi:hypothetical protein